MQSKSLSPFRGPVAPGLIILCGLLAFGATAQAQGAHTPAQASQVYRCPGPPVLYTDALSPKEAQEKGCRTIEGSPITVVSPPKPRPPVAGPSNAEGSTVKVDPALQKARDSDRRGVLERELREAEAKLAELQKEYANGTPERRGDERNYQKYLDRVAELKASISRQEADIAAIKREIIKLP